MLSIPLLNKLLTKVSTQHLGDYSDRLHSVCTVAVLVLFAMFVGGKQHFGQPIQCMLPAHLDRGAWTAYGQYYCFVEGTYRLNVNNTVPGFPERNFLRGTTSVNVRYYQWVPYFFLVQAFCFLAPTFVFRFLQSFSLIDMETAVEEAIVIRSEYKMEERKKKVEALNEFICAALDFRSDSARQGSLLGRLLPNRLSCYSSLAYLASKLLTVFNDYAQIRLIGHFLGIESTLWALNPLALATRVTSGDYSLSAEYFPRVTFCDMDRLTQAGHDTNTLQCVMMLNMINEKLFLLIWYWTVLLLCVSILSALYNFFQITHSACRESMVRFFIQMQDLTEEDLYLFTDKTRIRQFVFEVLGLDGVLVIRFIHMSAGAIVTRDLVSQLFRSFTTTYMGSSPIGFRRMVAKRCQQETFVTERSQNACDTLTTSADANAANAEKERLVRGGVGDAMTVGGVVEKQPPLPS